MIQRRVFWLLLCAALACTTSARADIFMYTDENGTIHITDTPMQGPYKLFKRIKTARRSAITSRPDVYSSAIKKASEKHGVDPNLIKSIIKAESDFDPTAVSHAGAVGLMQLMPQTAARYDVEDRYNPEQNIFGGTKYLKDLILKYNGNVKLALAAYNAGETAVKKYSGVPPYKETRGYVRKVIGHYNKLAKGKTTPSGQKTVYKYIRKDGTILLTDTPMTSANY